MTISMFSMSLPFTVNKRHEETGTAEVVISELILTWCSFFVFKKKRGKNCNIHTLNGRDRWIVPYN